MQRESFLRGSKRMEVKDAILSIGIDISLLEMMRAHFESHPTMPGEKEFKDRVNALLDDPDQRENLTITEEEEEWLASKYAETEVRETKFNGSRIADMYKPPVTDPETGKTVKQYKEPDENKFQLTHWTEGKTLKGMDIQAYILDVELRKVKDGVNIYAKTSPGAARFTKVGSVPENFLANNPMNVSRCPAQISIEDYSGGKLRNVSERLVVETSRMSGDRVELTNDMLDGLDKGPDLER